MVAAVITFAGVRGVCLVVLAIWAARRHRSLFTVLAQSYDAKHYVSIVEHGYSTMNLAFLPLFPLLTRATLILPISAAAAALAVAWAGSVAASTGIFKVGSYLGGARVGLVLVALWAALPHGLVEMMAYTEGLFTAFAAWSLYSALRERWLLAGVLCLFAAATRPTGIALVAALGVAALIAAVRTRAWQPLLAPIIGVLGFAAYMVWVDVRLGRLDGWFWVQRTLWFSRFDGGRFNVSQTKHLLSTDRNFLMIYVVTALVVLAALLLYLSISARQPLVLVLYSAGVLLLTLGSNTGYNKGRLLVPAFALLIPPAVALAKARTRDAVAILVLLVAVSAWFGGYLAFIWHWSP
jgi:hypothetical protein